MTIESQRGISRGDFSLLMEPSPFGDQENVIDWMRNPHFYAIAFRAVPREIATHIRGRPDTPYISVENAMPVLNVGQQSGKTELRALHGNGFVQSYEIHVPQRPLHMPAIRLQNPVFSLRVGDNQQDRQYVRLPYKHIIPLFIRPNLLYALYDRYFFLTRDQMRHMMSPEALIGQVQRDPNLSEYERCKKLAIMTPENYRAVFAHLNAGLRIASHVGEVR